MSHEPRFTAHFWQFMFKSRAWSPGEHEICQRHFLSQTYPRSEWTFSTEICFQFKGAIANGFEVLAGQEDGAKTSFRHIKYDTEFN